MSKLVSGFPDCTSSGFLLGTLKRKQKAAASSPCLDYLPVL